jgi:hypothetical protein
VLSPNELRFLSDLSADPRWKSILDYLEKSPPTYTPSEDTEEQKLVNKLLIDNGAYNENQRLLKILRSTK